MIKRYKEAIFKVDRWACILGNICIVFNMAIVTFNIITRNMFSKSLAGITDYAGFVSCLIVVLCLGYTEMMGGNPKVDFIVQKLPNAVQKLIYALIAVLDIVVGAALSYSFFQYAVSTAAANTASMNAKLPYAPFLVVCGIGMVLYTLTLLAKVLVKLSDKGGQSA